MLNVECYAKINWTKKYNLIYNLSISLRKRKRGCTVYYDRPLFAPPLNTRTVRIKYGNFITSQRVQMYYYPFITSRQKTRPHS
jgi:hypothetical protein